MAKGIVSKLYAVDMTDKNVSLTEVSNTADLLRLQHLVYISPLYSKVSCPVLSFPSPVLVMPCIPHICL